MINAGTTITSVFGSAPPATADLKQLKSYVKALCAVGLWVLLIEPGGKKPVDMRSAQRVRLDNTAAQAAARAEGRPDWSRVKAKAGVYLSTNDPKRLEGYLERYRDTYPDAAVNFGIDVGRSGLIVVDCDTLGQVHAFLDDFGVDHRVPPTVKSPGQRGPDGLWAHQDGGHFYFRVDGQEISQESGSLTAPGGYAVLWANRYVLIPPSVREEGAYRLTGIDQSSVQTGLVEMVNSAAASRIRARENRNKDADLTDAVNAWAMQTEWSDLLAPAGWSLAARQDNCGCDIWTAPGDHASPKSATAHDTQCTLGRYTTDNAPLHIWTDNPGPELEAWTSTRGKTMSRLQVAAALEYGGDMGAAMQGLNVLPESSAGLAFGQDLVSTSDLDAPLPEVAVPREKAPPEVKADPFVNAGSVARDESDSSDTDDPAPITGLPNIQPFDYWRDFPAPEFAIDGILEHRGFTALLGMPGIGKSGVALDMAAALCMGTKWLGVYRTLRQRVLYLPGEGLSGAVQRLKAWEAAHGHNLGGELFIGDSIIQVAASPAAWAAMIEKIMAYDIGLVIMDTFARAAIGLEENSAKDVGKGVARFDQVRKATGAGLMVVHHTNKGGVSGRGSSALNGALDTELLVREPSWNTDDCPEGRPMELWVAKQKNAAQPPEPIPMMAVSEGDSFVMTGPSGRVDDPMDMVATPRAVLPEPVVRTAARLLEYAQRLPTQGVTRGEFAYSVMPDDYTARRADAKTAWRMAVNEAVDLALRYEMLQTLTGSATGARYVPGPTPAYAAYEKWAKEAVPEQKEDTP